MKIIPTQQLIDIIIKASDQASSTANKVDQSMQKIGKTGQLLGKIPGFNTLSTKLSGVGQTIKGKLSPYLDSARSKLQNLSKGASGFGAVLGPLKGALSMTVGMIGYDLVNGLVQAARASINAASQLDYFGKRLKMSASETTQFKGEIDSLQKEFRKVDMTAVGATAEEMAVKFNLPKKSIGDLTRMTAVLSSTFVKEGRSQEDAILAVSDALDGQFKRLQEIGITQDTLKANGWNGNLEDQDSLIKALNKSMSEMGYEQTAKDITNLDEAWGALTIAGGQLLQKVLVPITPAIIKIIDAVLKVTDVIGPWVQGFANAVANMPDFGKIALLLGGLAVAVQVVSTWITATLVPALAAATLSALDFAAAMLANPLTWVVVALAAVAVAIYEVGKAFGWWTDVGSMLDAIWAGLNRLWSAFINHPDVQAILSVMSQAWNVLSAAVGRAISWVMSFFNNNSSGKFDIVRALIDGLGLAWKALTLPIRTVINVIKLLWNAINQWYLKTKARVELVKALFRALPNWIRGAISSLVNIITKPFKDAYDKITGTVDSIKNKAKSITNISLSSLTDKIFGPVRDAYDKIKDKVDQIKKKIKEIPVVGGFFGGEDLSFYGGSDLTSYSTEKLSVDMNHNINLSLDLRNVPPSMDEGQLVGLINETLDSKEFINRLVNNPDFQSLDNKVKQRIVLKTNRANGRGV